MSFFFKKENKKLNIFSNIFNLFNIKLLNNNPINDNSSEESSSEESSSEESSSEESSNPENNKYVLKNYEKDLELAINLSLIENEDNLCIICCDKKRDIAFIPCGHYICCNKCSNKCNENCPICRKKIIKKQKIFTL